MAIAFTTARIPPIHCGVGSIKHLTPWLLANQATAVLLVTGAHSLEKSGKLAELQQLIEMAGCQLEQLRCTGEPTAELVDQTTQIWSNHPFDAVIAVGGGSVTDLGKALAAMLPHGNSVMDHLEGVGKGLAHSGHTLPYLAIPTTSGTGGEVSKNAVLSGGGSHGFKKSLRHDNFVPSAVILDGDLLTSTHPAVTAACGMDAFTQLLESFLSPTASALSDAIVWSGLEHLIPNILKAFSDEAQNPDVRLNMAYAALCSGIGLANAGLGIVHGMAGPIGGWYPIPHGVICGSLMASAQRQNWDHIKTHSSQHPAVQKMARVGRLMPDGQDIDDDQRATEHLTATLEQWTDTLQLPRLGPYGITNQAVDRVVAASNNRNNPVQLSTAEIRTILERRL